MRRTRARRGLRASGHGLAHLARCAVSGALCASRSSALVLPGSASLRRSPCAPSPSSRSPTRLRASPRAPVGRARGPHPHPPRAR